MKKIKINRIVKTSSLAIVCSFSVLAKSQSIASPDVVLGEKDSIIAVEAEHFSRKNKEFHSQDMGQSFFVHTGAAPQPHTEVAATASIIPAFPVHWGTPPAVQTRDVIPLPGGYGTGSSTLADWIQSNLDQDAAKSTNALTMEANSFSLDGTGFYLENRKWLAIHPEKNKTAQAKQAFPFPSGRYNIILHAVGEEDGKSTFKVAINDQVIGSYECPLSEVSMEEGAAYNTSWANQTIDSGDIIAVSSTIGSNDGKEYSRGRWARISFTPADDKTKKAVATANISPTVAADSNKAPLVMPRKQDGKASVQITGNLMEWHKVSLTLDGPYAHEKDNLPNPFTDHQFAVTFTHESGAPSYLVPGYFAADGDAAESSSEDGTKWRAHLAPDKVGKWNYSISFTSGKHAALDGGGSPVKPFDGITGSFQIAKTNKSGRDFRGKGRLLYVGKHHLQFAATKEYFLKAGTDAPESFLAYKDFDNTIANKKNIPLKSWAPHISDWKTGDPTWKNGKGKGIIGALNYLAFKGLNAFSFLPYNAGGDADNVWPFISRNEKLNYDCSKLDQWGIVFSHATANGLYLHFKLQENEIDDNRRGEKGNHGNVPESLDGGKLGPQRKLYCREIIARYAHELALNWNIGEENTQTTEEINAMVNYIRSIDPYQHHVVIHTFPGQQDKVYTPLLGYQSKLSGASLQNNWNKTHERTLKWVTESRKAGRPWVVACDEQGGADTGVPPDLGYENYAGKKKDGGSVQTVDDIRKQTLWGNLMAGGAGVEYYFGYQLPQNDLIAEDLRSRDRSWDYCRIALEFFRKEKIPFEDMINANQIISTKKKNHAQYCLAKNTELYLIYLPDGSNAEIDLTSTSGNYSLDWFNPRDGGNLQSAPNPLKGGGKVILNAPDDKDWLAVIRQK